jgi:hypothetical protein
MKRGALQYVKRGLISQSDFDFLAEEIDPSKTKKYMHFIIKSFLVNTDLDLLRNRITEYDTLVNRNQVDKRDIGLFRTFSQFNEYVQKYNDIKSTRELKREIKREADTVLDNENIFIVCPQSHDAVCLYGAGTRWCITSKNSVHWEHYHYNCLITFYIIEVRGEEIKKKLMQGPYVNQVSSDELNLKQELWKVAIVVYPDGRLEAYNANDKRIGRNYGGLVYEIELY